MKLLGKSLPWFVVAVAVLIFLSSANEVYDLLCAPNAYNHNEYCTKERVISGAWQEARETVGRNADAIIAIFTIFLAFFTKALVDSTEKLWDAGERQLGVARQSADAALESARVARDTLIATRRPLMALKIKPTMFHGSSSGFGLNLEIKAKNIGATPAVDVAVAVDFIDERELGTSDEDVIRVFETRWDQHSEREVVFPDGSSDTSHVKRNFGISQADHSEWCEFVAWISYRMMFDDRHYYTAIFFTLFDKATENGILSPDFRGRLSDGERLCMHGRNFIT